jgi:hypothetical protein
MHRINAAGDVVSVLSHFTYLKLLKGFRLDLLLRLALDVHVIKN